MSFVRSMPCIAAAAATLLYATASAAQPWPAPIQALRERGLTIIKQIDAPGGLTGFAARAGSRPVALYLTADGQHVIIGTLLDAEGENVTKAQLDAAITRPARAHAWTRLENARWIADGADDAPRVIYVFDDPNCGFCHRFFKQSRPWVEAGRVQIRHLPVAILRPSSTGKAAALLTADDPTQAFRAHEANYRSGGIEPLDAIPADISQQLAANNQLMSELGINGTPGIVYRKADDQVGVKQGVPQGELVTAILGPR